MQGATTSRGWSRSRSAGRNVFGVRLLTSTLEEVYVEAVSGETS